MTHRTPAAMKPHVQWDLSFLDICSGGVRCGPLHRAPRDRKQFSWQLPESRGVTGSGLCCVWECMFPKNSNVESSLPLCLYSTQAFGVPKLRWGPLPLDDHLWISSVLLTLLLEWGVPAKSAPQKGTHPLCCFPPSVDFLHQNCEKSVSGVA